MLKELRIENLAIIEKLDLEFTNGFIALTGETGAGKSIILDGINLLIGEKVSTEMIRSDSEYLLAEGVFDISEETEEVLREMDIEVEDNEIIVQRRLERNGKGKAFVNGRRMPVSNLKNIMSTLVDLVGQNNHQMLFNKNYHIKLIDRFIDEEAIELKKEIEKIVEKYIDLEKKILKIKEIKKEIKEKKELYNYQLNEINEANLKEKEDEELEEEYKKFFNAGKIRDNLSQAHHLLKEGEINTISLFSTIKKNLSSIARFSKEYEDIYEKLEKVYYEIKEISYGIEESFEDIDLDEDRLNKIVDRLDKINNLKKKYASNIKDIILYREDLEKKLSFLEKNEDLESIISIEKNNLVEEYFLKSEKLSKKRMEISKKIEYNLIEELKDLNMKDFNFKINFEKRDDLNKNGLDVLEFLISTNLGEDLKPLYKIASGGEVSRILLALKSIFSKVERIPLLIFDEIDTGVGGETVNKVAFKLKKISENTQLICITHSPQIAAKADEQFYIEKNVYDNKTISTVKKLNEKERVNEISRMLAGEEASSIVIEHSKELLKK